MYITWTPVRRRVDRSRIVKLKYHGSRHDMEDNCHRTSEVPLLVLSVVLKASPDAPIAHIRIKEGSNCEERGVGCSLQWGGSMVDRLGAICQATLSLVSIVLLPELCPSVLLSSKRLSEAAVDILSGWTQLVPVSIDLTRRHLTQGFRIRGLHTATDQTSKCRR